MTVEKLRTERGIELRKLRKSKGVTQAEAAKISGISLATVIRMERGKSNYCSDREFMFRVAMVALPDKEKNVFSKIK